MDVLQVFSVGYIYNQILSGTYKKVLLIATSQQGETIPGIAHAISVEV